MTIHLYAELLTHIRTLSVQVSLSTDTNTETKAKVSTDGKFFTLTHEGETANINLPVQVISGHTTATLTVPAVPTKELSFRVQLQEKPDTEGLLSKNDYDESNVIPWTAMSLNPDVEIACKSCNAVIVPRGKIQIWKDLPSENWAEMMDFWHCHRPSEPHESGQEALEKGYSVSSTLALHPGVGMVNPTAFLLVGSDCQNLTNTSPSRASQTPISLECSQCQTLLGRDSDASGNYKVLKMHLSVSQADQAVFQSYDEEKWLACHLIAAVETQGVRKFKVYTKDPGHGGLKVWIFTPDLTVSTSVGRWPSPMRATKVLWDKLNDLPAENEKLDREYLSEGEIEMTMDEMLRLTRALERSALMLPETARTFQDWAVALLPRFTTDDISR